MPANFYDINAHPTKMEVRFEDESKIFQSIYHAIKDTLLKEIRTHMLYSRKLKTLCQLF